MVLVLFQQELASFLFSYVVESVAQSRFGREELLVSYLSSLVMVDHTTIILIDYALDLQPSC